MLRFFARRLRDAQNEEKGFTLIELLVVIIIIGILAAIAIPTFLAQRERAWEAAAQSDLRNAAAAATSCSVDQGGDYTGCNVAALPAFGWNNSADVTVTDGVANATQWSSTSQHDLDDTIYTFDTADPATPGQVYCSAACP